MIVNKFNYSENLLYFLLVGNKGKSFQGKTQSVTAAASAPKAVKPAQKPKPLTPTAPSAAAHESSLQGRTYSPIEILQTRPVGPPSPAAGLDKMAAVRVVKTRRKED
jgi:hypothetical protein